MLFGSSESIVNFFSLYKLNFNKIKEFLKYMILDFLRFLENMQKESMLSSLDSPLYMGLNYS